ncbi:MAG: hypothetical protein V1839_03355 [archaeon]
MERCGFGRDEVPAHDALFEITLYGIATIISHKKNRDERCEAYGIRYACAEHLESVCLEFREDKKLGDEIRNMRSDEKYWRISDALKNISQFPAEITVFYKSPETLPKLRKSLEDYLGTAGELKDNALYAQGGRESVMLLARSLLDTIKNIGLDIKIKQK